MKNIADIVKIVTLKDANKIFDSEENRNPVKSKLLYEGLSRNHFKDRAHAVKTLYRKKSGDANYRKLKSRLSEKLLSRLIYSNPEKLIRSNSDRVYHKCLRNVVAANLLYLNYSKNAANELLRRNIILAQHHHFTDVMVASARLLRYHAALSGARKKFIHYNHLVKHFTAISESELEVECASQQLILELHHSTTANKVLQKKFHAMFVTVQREAKKFPSRMNKLNYFRFGIRYNEFMNDHRAVLSFCKQAETYLHDHPQFVQKIRLGEFGLYKMNSCLQLRDYKSGEQSASDCDHIFQPGTDNWFIFLEYFFLLCMHSGKYHKAAEVLKKAMGHNRFNKMQKVRVEKWKIFEAYLHFISPSDTKGLFNIHRFVNEVPLHSTDKSGFNLAIIIAQIILFVDEGQTDRVISQNDALKIYAKRYIRMKANFRTYYFMKMLLTMIKYNFDIEKTKQISEKYYEKMISKSSGEKYPLEEFEIIPYETLWEILLKRSDRFHHLVL